MKNEQSIDKLLDELDQKISWFHSDDFRLEEAKDRFDEVQKLSAKAEEALENMKNEINVIGKDFSE